MYNMLGSRPRPAFCGHSPFGTATCVGLLAFTTLGLGQTPAEPEQVIVARTRIDCLRQNASLYLATGKDPIIVFLELCPKVEPSAGELTSLAQNSSLVIIKAKDEPSTVRSILVLERQQLECLANVNPAVIQEIPGEDGLVRLDFSACANETQ